MTSLLKRLKRRGRKEWSLQGQVEHQDASRYTRPPALPSPGCSSLPPLAVTQTFLS